MLQGWQAGRWAPRGGAVHGGPARPGEFLLEAEAQLALDSERKGLLAKGSEAVGRVQARRAGWPVVRELVQARAGTVAEAALEPGPERSPFVRTL